MYFKEFEKAKIDLKNLSIKELESLEKKILDEPENYTASKKLCAGATRATNCIKTAIGLTAYLETTQWLRNSENCNEKHIQKPKGGKRENSGRKKKEPTVMVRCPLSIKNEILALIKKYKETGKL